MFQRNKPEESSHASAEDADGSGKGRPTPKRKEAESARKKRRTQPLSRKEANKANRKRREEQRAKTREAMQSGDDRYLPARDQGPVRRLCRDVVDSRYNVAEFLLPILVVILVLSVVQQPWTVTVVYAVWIVTIVAAAVDIMLLVRKLRAELKERFPHTNTRGSTMYAVLRSTQLRRFRLPKAQIDRGAPLKNRY